MRLSKFINTVTNSYIILSLFVIVALSPFVYTIYTSLQLPKDYERWVSLRNLTFQNYIYVSQHAPIERWYFNTIVVTLIVVVSNLVMGTLAGYALARFSFPGKNLIFIFILGVMIIPIQTYLIPLYIMMARFGWLNSYLSLTFPIMVFPFGIFLMRQFFLTIPRDLEDAAKVDGLGRLGTLVRIILPISKTPLVTLSILSIIWTWNNFIIPVTMVNDPDYYVVTVGLNTLKNVNYELPTVTMAGVMYLTTPLILTFIFLQKYFIKGIATAGLKG